MCNAPKTLLRLFVDPAHVGLLRVIISFLSDMPLPSLLPRLWSDRQHFVSSIVTVPTLPANSPYPTYVNTDPF